MTELAAAADTHASSTSRSLTLRRLAALGAVALAAATVAKNGLDADNLLDVFGIAVLVAVTVTDLERRIIPNRIVLPAWAIALAANCALHPARALEWIVASFGCALVFLLFARLTGGGLGMGDVKLIGFLGALLGKDLLVALLIGSGASAVFAASILLREGREGRTRTYAFGPFLAAGAIATILFG
jgi:leader peptidase (prepilin peptidase) / N-methyltransferase